MRDRRLLLESSSSHHKDQGKFFQNVFLKRGVQAFDLSVALWLLIQGTRIGILNGFSNDIYHSQQLDLKAALCLCSPGVIYWPLFWTTLLVLGGFLVACTLREPKRAVLVTLFMAASFDAVSSLLYVPLRGPWYLTGFDQQHTAIWTIMIMLVWVVFPTKPRQKSLVLVPLLLGYSFFMDVAKLGLVAETVGELLYCYFAWTIFMERNQPVGLSNASIGEPKQ
jgi:hypothetical protein